METIIIRARNNLDIPIRLTLTRSVSQCESEILITVGHEGATLKDFYKVCVDTDLIPNQEWGQVGSLSISTKSNISFSGEP